MPDTPAARLLIYVLFGFGKEGNIVGHILRSDHELNRATLIKKFGELEPGGAIRYSNYFELSDDEIVKSLDDFLEKLLKASPSDYKFLQIFLCVSFIMGKKIGAKENMQSKYASDKKSETDSESEEPDKSGLENKNEDDDSGANDGGAVN